MGFLDDDEEGARHRGQPRSARTRGEHSGKNSGTFGSVRGLLGAFRSLPALGPVREGLREVRVYKDFLWPALGLQFWAHTMLVFFLKPTAALEKALLKRA